MEEKGKRLREIYEELLRKYGPQGWWPIGGNYHPKNFECPKDDKERFEIMIGCILTQNTSWKNVNTALKNLEEIDAIDHKKITGLNPEKLKNAIRPAGYFNQKAERLKMIATWFNKQSKKTEAPSRENLLKLKGVGPETADSILLYAYKKPEFIVDTYTRRILQKENIITGKESYEEIKYLFENSLEKDHQLYQEYHALIVEEGKNISRSKKKANNKSDKGE